MEKIIFYTNPYSRGRVVRWMLEETGLPYETRIMEFGGSIKSPEYLAINPMGKVPALVHGDIVITEVAAICAYLADLCPEKNLAPPPGSPLRGTYYRWLFFTAGPLEMASTAKAYDWRIDNDNASSVGCGHYEDTIRTMESALENGPFLCGEQFTAADLLMSSYIGWEIMQKNLPAKPAFKRFVKSLSARDAARRAASLDDAQAQKS